MIFPDGPNSIQITTSEYVIHPDYDWSIMYSDIAIIKLPSKIEVNCCSCDIVISQLAFKFTDFIAPICLPPNGDDAYEGLSVTVLGWGSEGLDHKEVCQYPNRLYSN